MMMSAGRILLLLFWSITSLCADSLTDIIQSCGNANFGTGKYWLVQCLQEPFTAYPVHVTLGSIAPGAGTAALGLNASWILPINTSEIQLSSEALMSTDTSWLVQTQALIATPTLTFKVKRSTSPPHRVTGLGVGGLLEQAHLDAKATAMVRARYFDAKEQWFYGLGPVTSLAGDSKYSQKQFELGTTFNNPFTPWISGGIAVDYLRPRIVEANSGIQLTSLYNAASAPGLMTRDDFVRFEPYIALHIPAHRSLSNTARIGYSFYSAVGDQQYSFQRLSVSDVTSVPLLIRIPPLSTKTRRSAVGGFFCSDVRSGDRCSLGNLSLIGRADVSYTGAGHYVPFFLDPTLGGQDLQGNDTLRGFGDYRFRAPNRILFQVEYQHPIWSVFGLIVFYDTGKVGLQPSDLNLGQLRHDIGLGVNITAGNHQIARLYVAFGTGEPVQIQPRFGGLL
jgi:hypothetical protein